jgi:hypothetical protein
MGADDRRSLTNRVAALPCALAVADSIRVKRVVSNLPAAGPPSLGIIRCLDLPAQKICPHTLRSRSRSRCAHAFSRSRECVLNCVWQSREDLLIAAKKQSTSVSSLIFLQATSRPRRESTSLGLRNRCVGKPGHPWARRSAQVCPMDHTLVPRRRVPLRSTLAATIIQRLLL